MVVVMGFWSSLFGRPGKSLPIKRVPSPPRGSDLLLPSQVGDDILGSFHREIERVFGALARGLADMPAGLTPRVAIEETDRTIEISAEMPGLEEKDVEVSLADDVLTIKGRKKVEKESKTKGGGTMRQQSFGAFFRSLRLPPGTDPDQVRASLDRGTLRVTVPKPKETPPRRIAIKPR
jgi:HSP20 family protein